VSRVPARISIVVPVYNVAAYLEACLESLARQTVPDLEVLVVDDGSTDGSVGIAERFAARDPRFQLVRQANAGQGAARNNGVARANGAFLAFVDGDDVVPHYAYEAMLDALERTGSDFATGNVRRLTSLGTHRAVFLGDAFDRERLRTHILHFPSLTADRLACNKLLRRSFWDRHRLRFPEGVRNEDIRAMMRAHYLADSVDVLAETVYWWRRREGGDLSGSQRRFGEKALRDRVAAVDDVSRFLAERGLSEAKLAYDRAVVSSDLRYFLDALDRASDTERQLFVELANDFLDRADPRVLEQPLAIERLKWQLVRRRALAELLEVLRFQVEELDERPPVRRLRRFYGDYPYRSDRSLRIPRAVYRLDEELALVAKVEELRWEGECLRISGYAYIELLGAPSREACKIEVVARRRRGRQLAFETKTVYRPDVTAGTAQQVASLDWSGFVATLDARRLKRRGRWRHGGWTICVRVRTSGVVRESSRPRRAPLHPWRSGMLSVRGAQLLAGPAPGGELVLRVRRHVPVVHAYSVDDSVLTLEGEVRQPDEAPTLIARRRDGTASVTCPLELEPLNGSTRFLARVPLADLLSNREVADDAAHTRELGEGVAWDLELGGSRTQSLALHEGAAEATWVLGRHELALERTRYGNLALVERSIHPVIREIEWSPGGILRLIGSFRASAADYELLLRSRSDGESHAFVLRHEAADATLVAEANLGAIDSLAGRRPLTEGRWDILVARVGLGGNEAVQTILDHALLETLPASATSGHKSFRLGVGGHDVPVLDVGPDLADDERGGYPQRLLRTDYYRAGRRGELRDAVLYECFGGLEYSDDPRAIHEELVRRGAPFEHLWVVRDGRCNVPETASPVRALSKKYYEAYARARYVVANDHWPRFAVRRPEQTWLQTWHGAPLKLLGQDLARRPKAVREYRRFAAQANENWHHVLSTAAWATPILERAFPASTSVLETGLPRTDVLTRTDSEALARQVKRRLGLPEHVRAILYAPTYRDQLGARGGYRLGPLLDLAAVSSALGEEDVLLFRRHRRVVGTLPTAADGVVDVSAYPDATELLLAVDMLITDYSSAVFDFALTGRPIVFFTPDLETYRDDVRGFSIDFEREAPGPLLRTTEEVVDAIGDLDDGRAPFLSRYEHFVSTYCTLDDGGATSRVIERVFDW
jgi:CDP-glycerol glycerophosphotransferase